ncbi:hypothetical protein Q5P01_015538 [Channa striata]|uniref:UPAR/Ly6 domain-containing protein n=1 Tax=Channa striata TaxID=64152 RepID=A0AA88MDK3_CHASR|nr:hypothetical protein Q5P01_015538 [Channa striata]
MFSYDFGTGHSDAALHCCETDGCNTLDLSVPRVRTPNSLRCFTCADPGGSVCNDTLRCVGAQDRCVSGNGLRQKVAAL